MPERPALTLRRLVVRASSRSEAEAAAAAFAGSFARPLESSPNWDAGPRARLSLHARSGPEAGAAAANALRKMGGCHG